MSGTEYKVNRIARDAMFLRYKKAAAGSSLAPNLEAVKAECEAARETGGEVAYDAALARHIEEQEEIDKLSARIGALYPGVKEGDYRHTRIMDRFGEAHEKGGQAALRQAYLDVIAEAEQAAERHKREKPFYERVRVAGGDFLAANNLASRAGAEAGAANTKAEGNSAGWKAAYEAGALAALPEIAATAEAAKAREEKAEKLLAEFERLLERLGSDAPACKTKAYQAGVAALDPIVAADRTAMLRAAGIEDIPAYVLTAPSDVFDEVLRRACFPPGVDPDVFEAQANEDQRRSARVKLADIRREQAFHSRGLQSVAFFTAALAVVRPLARRAIVASIATVPVGLFLGYLCYLFADAAKDEHYPSWYVWMALIGSGVGLAALSRRSAPSLVWLGLGLPVWAVALAVMMIAAPSPIILLAFFVILWGLVIYPDKWARTVAVLVWRNATKHKEATFVTTDLGGSAFRRSRIRALGAVFWFSISALVALVGMALGSGLGRPVGVGVGFAVLLAMIALGNGVSLFALKGERPKEAGAGFFTILGRIIQEDFKRRGPLRMERVIIGGEDKWVKRGHQGGTDRKGEYKAGPSLVLLEGGGSREAARPGYEQVFDAETGKLTYKQIILGNPNVAPEVAPLAATGKLASGGGVREEDVDG